MSIVKYGLKIVSCNKKVIESVICSFYENYTRADKPDNTCKLKYKLIYKLNNIN